MYFHQGCPPSEDQRRRCHRRRHTAVTRGVGVNAAAARSHCFRHQTEAHAVCISPGPVCPSRPRSCALTTVEATVKSKIGIKVCDKPLSLHQCRCSHGSICSRSSPVMFWIGLSSNAVPFTAYLFDHSADIYQYVLHSAGIIQLQRVGWL